jgi:hypothetical protein
MNRRTCASAVLILASWQFLGCGPAETDETDETLEIGRPDESDGEVRATSTARNEFCVGESTHTIDTANGLVRWRFSTDNDSSYSKKQALVIGRVFHQSTGIFLECSANENVSYNACEILTPIGSEYTRSTGQHRCCIKKGWFGSFVCREVGTGDSL